MKRNFLLAIIINFLLVACGQDIDNQTSITEKDKQINQTTENLDDETSNNQNVVEESTNENESGTTNDLLDELKVHYIDAGQADATLFQFTYDNKPYNILYDAGDWNKNDVVNYLDAQGVT